MFLKFNDFYLSTRKTKRRSIKSKKLLYLRSEMHKDEIL